MFFDLHLVLVLSLDLCFALNFLIVLLVFKKHFLCDPRITEVVHFDDTISSVLVAESLTVLHLRRPHFSVEHLINELGRLDPSVEIEEDLGQLSSDRLIY